ncbi:MotA/TolQ/ExbB proton channel family protein [Vibrio sp. 10N.261.46.A3]|uniref:MotA/TolQ/ExbB proton channel family protein n=1 Tax=Vibrio sp. 10N.261.46.A3 TaxID=3229658 RepID=UPI003551FA5A
MIDNIMVFFKSGGVFMFPIAAIGLIALAIVIERFFVMMNYRRQILKDTYQFSQIAEEDIGEALTTLTRGRSILAGTIKEASIEYQEHAISREEFEEVMSISAIHSLRRLSRRTTVISTLANVVTLLGLLGTIMGLIQSFASVAQASGSDKSTLLSESVSVAMNTTAFGLMIAIPLLLMYVFIDNASNKAIESLQAGCAKVLNKLYQKRTVYEK